jgi:hypothetical protein
MFSVPTEMPAADRARWLAELADALDQAQRILFELELPGSSAADALELCTRIEAARFEVQSLRLSRSTAARRKAGPDWTNLLPWPSDRASG